MAIESVAIESVNIEPVDIEPVDIEPEDAGEPKRSDKAAALPVAREPDAEALKESVKPELPHAEPAPKRRGRK